jgi:preprotein translocase subunit SecG
MTTILTIIHVLASFLLIVVVLLQSGKGGGLASGLGGSGAATQTFGGGGAGTVLGRATVILATTFMVTSLWLAYLSSRPQSLIDLEAEASTGGTVTDKIIEEGTEPPLPGTVDYKKAVEEGEIEKGAVPARDESGDTEPAIDVQPAGGDATGPTGEAPGAPDESGVVGPTGGTVAPDRGTIGTPAGAAEEPPGDEGGVADSVDTEPAADGAAGDGAGDGAAAGTESAESPAEPGPAAEEPADDVEGSEAGASDTAP